MVRAPQMKVDIDQSRARRKFRAIRRETQNTTQVTTNRVGELGKQFARKRAPYWSGDTFRNIVLFRGSGNTEATIMAKNPTASDGHTRRIQNFHLVRWMHTSPNAASHIRSGDRQFMYRTSSYLRKKFPQEIRGSFNKVIARNN